VRREQRLRWLWTVGSLLSIALNVFLCLALLIGANQLFTIKKVIGTDLLGGLLVNFVGMARHTSKQPQVRRRAAGQFDRPSTRTRR
jgi:hypothetical protein